MKVPNYDQQNLESARLILNDIARHGGEDAGLVTLGAADDRRA
jgi:hypothetical protein